MSKQVLFWGLLLSFHAHAANLADSKYFDYKVIFTNPVCADYKYDRQVIANDGSTLTQKPKNVYCKREDYANSADRKGSVQDQFIEWIRDVETKEIFLTYLSFSNKYVGEELCKAIEQRNVKVRFIMDAGGPPEGKPELTQANKLMACKPASGRAEDKPELVIRGNAAKKTPKEQYGDLGYAHNKIVIFNPNTKGKIRIIFSSGNLTSGVALHHENWHFITTDVNTNFAQSHLCAMNGMYDQGKYKKDFARYMKECREQTGIPIEDDIQSFFVPGDGKAAMGFLLNELKKSKSVFVAAHRFSNTDLFNGLAESLKNGTKVKLVADDDLYWVGKLGTAVGPNMLFEYKDRVKPLKALGLETRWLETNHTAGQPPYLHHNKYLIFDGRAVFAGAGNLTNDAFTNNFENFYMIRIPSVVKAFEKQRDFVWKTLATPEKKMPSENITP